MSKFGPKIGDADFWWKRYFCGLPLAAAFALCGIYSLIFQHSYAFFDGHRRGFNFIPVDGEQAVAMGCAYLGMGFVFFGTCYLENDERWNHLSSWISIPGALLISGGVFWQIWFNFTH